MSALAPLLLFSAAVGAVPGADPGAEPGASGGPGLAIACAKALVCSPSPDEVQFLDRAVVLVSDGRIEAVGTAAELEVPAGYELLDVGDSWVAPGLVDLHSHIGGWGGLNDTVYQANTGLRIHPCVVPSNPQLEVCVAAGVTTILFIPGSGSNVGGVGVLMKTSLPTYDESVLRHHGSLKVAQGDNPKRWGYGMGRDLMNWTIRDTMRRGLEYAAGWRLHEVGGAPAPELDPQWEIFRSLAAGEAQISTHTQVPQVVLATLRILAEEHGLPVYLDHSTVGGWKLAEVAEELGVPAIVGPRSVDTPSRGMINWAQNTDHEGFRGVAAGYQERGHSQVGFNTDAPVVNGEDLFLQAAMGVRYGFDDSELGTVRGLTVVPAVAAGIEDRVGSLTPGCDADLIVVTGHPADPRSHVELVLIEGRVVYDTAEEARRY
jgi:imidazolonepropionase-like amidohydrolase